MKYVVALVLCLAVVSCTPRQTKAPDISNGFQMQAVIITPAEAP